MSPEDSADPLPLDPRLQAWIDEVAAVKGNAPWASAKEAEVMSLLEATVREPPREMSHETAAAILEAVQVAYRRHSGRAGLRDVVLSVAAVLFGLAMGVATLSRFQPSPPPNPRTNSVEIIKEVSFESIHEGKVVRFQLELSRVR